MRKTPSFKLLRPSSDLATRVGRGNRKRDTRPEVLLRRALWFLGLRYRVHVRELPGLPDIVFTRQRIAIFCDGDFWHGRNWVQRRERLAKGSNSEYWIAKIERNMQRDQDVDAKLKVLGWSVIRVWENDIKKDPEAIASFLASLINRQC